MRGLITTPRKKERFKKAFNKYQLKKKILMEKRILTQEELEKAVAAKYPIDNEYTKAINFLVTLINK